MLLIGTILLAIFVLPDGWQLPAVGAAAVIEIAETAVWIRLSRRGRAKVGAETLIGTTVEVVEACRPIGMVRVQGELWRARCDEGAAVGERLRVRGIERLTLLVEHAVLTTRRSADRDRLEQRDEAFRHGAGP